MTRAEKVALRKSVRHITVRLVHHYLIGLCDGTWWEGQERGCISTPVWTGPEVKRIYREVYRDVCKALKVKS